MTQIFKRILDKKISTGLTWDEIARLAHIRVASWMTGLPTSSPSDEDLKKLAPVLKTSYKRLKSGKE